MRGPDEEAQEIEESPAPPMPEPVLNPPYDPEEGFDWTCYAEPG